MLILLLGLSLFLSHFHHAIAAPIDDLVAAAKKEWVIELLAPSTTGDKGAQALGARSTRNMASSSERGRAELATSFSASAKRRYRAFSRDPIFGPYRSS